MKYSLLQIVQDILNDLDSDYANSIDDTVESQQVAQIVRTCYNEMISNRNWPHLKKLVQLEASGSTSKPNYLKLPEGTKELILLQYDVKKLGETKVQYKDIKYKEPHEFLQAISPRNNDNSNVSVVTDFSGVSLLVFNDRAPEYWTSFDDEWIVMDSYLSDVDVTLQKSKSRCLAYIEPAWEHVDTYIPDLPEEAFAGLIAEAKSTAFLSLKQMANEKAEQKATRQKRWLSRKAWRASGGVQYENYGRK